MEAVGSSATSFRRYNWDDQRRYFYFHDNLKSQS